MATYLVWLPLATISLSLFMNLIDVYASVLPTDLNQSLSQYMTCIEVGD